MMAKSLMMQKPEPASGKAWCVPPAVLQASLYCRASLAVSSVPAAHHGNIIMAHLYTGKHLNPTACYSISMEGGSLAHSQVGTPMFVVPTQCQQRP